MGKLKDVSFEYFVNGNRIVPDYLTKSTINQVFGSNEYSIVGTLPENEEINMIEVIMKAKDQTGPVENKISLPPCILPLYPVPSPEPLVYADMFIQRCWCAFYPKDCTDT